MGSQPGAAAGYGFVQTPVALRLPARGLLQPALRQQQQPTGSVEPAPSSAPEGPGVPFTQTYLPHGYSEEPHKCGHKGATH